MNDLSTVINREGGGLKENPPCTPLKENKGTSIFTVPVPVPIARTHAPAQGTPTAERTGTGTGTGTEAAADRTGTGSVNIGNSGTGKGTAPRHIAVSAKFILDGYNALGLRYDAVQTALYALRIPVASNGYNNFALRTFLERPWAKWQNRSDQFCHFSHTSNICGHSDGVQVTRSTFRHHIHPFRAVISRFGTGG